jgi:manganese/zinc/iron transport system ATP- binding protein
LTSTASPEAAVELRGLTVRYGAHLGLREATAIARPGALVSLVGLNGSGKSTLLRAVVGMVPSTGHVSVMGRSDADRRRLIAYLPQREDINWNFPITALEVVLMGRAGSLTRLGRTSRGDRIAAVRALEQVDLAALRSQPIGALSGGQQQRVILARALYSQAPVMLLDEPLTGVDPTTREIVLDLLQELGRRGTTILLATHDVHEAASTGDRVWGLNGTVVADVPAARLLDEEVLREIYGERLLVLPGGRLAVGDQAHL